MTLRVFYVVDTSLLTRPFAKQAIADGRDQVKRYIHDNAKAEGIAVEVGAGSGDRAAAIVEDATAVRADLIVMGASEHATLDAAMRGTTIDRIVRTAHCPVLAVKTRPRRNYRFVLAGLDGGESSQHAFDLARHTFSDAKITVVHAVEGAAGDRSGSLLAKVRSVIGEARQTTFSVKKGRPRDVLTREAEHLRPDLVVLGTHGRSGVPKMLLGSVAEALLATLRCDVFVARGRHPKLRSPAPPAYSRG